MILIGTSGSTKCDWQLVKQSKSVAKFSSQGINPFFHSEDDIKGTIAEIEEIISNQQEINEVYLYSAGCSTKPLRLIVERALSAVIPKAHRFVNHDIVAAAFATYENMPAITCLIGTGSNSCFFDGDIVRQEVTGLDYILGDEGSGAYFGRKLLKLYMYKKMPDHLLQDFEREYSISKNEILQNVYMKPYANVYLASFIRFINKHQSDPFFVEMIKKGLNEFIDIFVKSYDGYNSMPVHFVGSIPFFFENSLKEVLSENNVLMGKIIKEPIDELVEYHIRKSNK